MSEYNQLKSQLSQTTRKQTGSLAVRDLGSLVSAADVVSTENLITLFVVVPRHVKKDWLAVYETLTDYVVSSCSMCCMKVVSCVGLIASSSIGLLTPAKRSPI